MATQSDDESRERSAEAEIRHSYDRQRRAMLHADTGTLGDLLAADFTLTHLTGYHHAKREWLAEIDAGRFRYHAIDDREVTVTLDGDRATLVAQTAFDATAAVATLR